MCLKKLKGGVLFKKISKEVYVICPFIISVGFIH